MIIIPDIPNIVIEDVSVADEITLTLRIISPTACCSSCGSASSQVQSRYTRTLRDLPASGRPILLRVQVRRFFCKKNSCPRKIFAEQFPELCRPYAQRTKRLQEALRWLGLIVGGQAAGDISREQGMSGSRDTILRLTRKSELPHPKEPRVVGLDDWALKRGRRYGTLICDLEQGRPIDLLPDRRAETVSSWLRAHPHIDIVSRDGSGEYASAIKKGAPQARQVSDRWHLVKNLAACVSVQMAKVLAELRRAEQDETKTSEEGKLPHEPYRPLKMRGAEQAQLARQAERMARYEQILALYSQGMNKTRIAVRLGISRNTVQRWLSRGDIPYSGPQRQQAHLIDAYKTYLAQRWHQGCHNGLQLEKDLRAKGYKGSRRGIYYYLETLKASAESPVSRNSAPVLEHQTAPVPFNPLLTISAPRATWLFFRRAEDLKAEEQELLGLLRQASSQVEVVYQLVEKFLHMVRERTGEQLDAWLGAVEATHLEAFQSFVNGIQQDKDAVFAGLTLPWSNGPLEGNVNRLKLIKKSMYGRAEFDLLKIRVLYQNERVQERKNKQKNNQEHLGDAGSKQKMTRIGTISQDTTTEFSEVA
jgi:transposase